MGNNSIKPLKNIYINSFVTSLLLSSFIYFEHFGFSYKFLNTIVGVLGLYSLLHASKRELFFIGALTSLMWFYWVGMSFRYTDFPFIAFLVPVGIMTLYGVIFYGVYFFQNIYYRAFISLFVFDFIEPFGFTWFKIETLFANSFLFPEKIYLASLLLALTLFSTLKKSPIKFILPLIPFLFAFSFQEEKIPLPDLRIKLVDLKLDQKTKWKREFRNRYTQEALDHIKSAITNRYDVVVVPESAIPLYLNRQPEIVETLKDLSSQIDIVVGSLKYENKRSYNSTYIFRKQKLLVADKVFLVPFGEASAISGIFGKWINKTFFNDTDDFMTAAAPTDFFLGKEKFRSAICYEAGVEAMFKDAPKYMIAISNNGWFTPSIEPTLQKLVMITWGRKYGVKIFHATNMSSSEVIN